jgi:phosphopantothenoylcysteine decarboxylase/phosphopantothenate--cysteine ligase
LDALSGYDLSATAHIDLANWGDAFIISPCSANTMAKFANGLADDALSTEALAFTGPVLLAPAMNTRMWDAKATQANLELLLTRGFHVIGPAAGDLACGEVGMGKMSEPQEIFARALSLLQEPKLAGKKILITSGPTRAYLDSVRFLTNRSSGKMGYALATAAQSLGAEVVFVTGPVDEKWRQPRGVRVISVETTDEMQAAAMAELEGADMVVAAAAVVDFEAEKRDGKIERKGQLDLNLRASTDVIASLANARNAEQIFIAFAAESGTPEEQAARAMLKLERKKVDFVALNDIGRGDIGFDREENEIRIFSRNGSPVKTFAKASKLDIARSLLLYAAGADA